MTDWRDLPDNGEIQEPPGVYDPPGASTPPQPPAHFKSAAQFASEYTPLAYTLEPLLRSASIYTLTARTGAGKTAFLIVAALAVVSGRSDILVREVHKGRVAYLACENPDDIRMRLKIASYLLNIDLNDLGDDLVVLDFRAKPEAVCDALKVCADKRPFSLVIVDTLAAFFDGDNVNDAVQGGQFMRRLRPLTQVAGNPTVLVAAHPVKNAGEDNLVPYGSGAILNEVDGNLTLWKRAETGLVALHWQGKLRGLEFEPALFRFEVAGCADILDAKGREVQLPVLLPASDKSADEREREEADTDLVILRALIEAPASTIRDYADRTGIPRSSVNRRLGKLAKAKLVEQVLDKWTVTPKGRKAAA